MTHVKAATLLVGAVAFPVIVWLVMYFDAGQPAKVALVGAILAAVLFAVFGLFIAGTLQPLLAAGHPLMAFLLFGGNAPIISVGIFCFLMFICEVGSIPFVFPELNFWKCTMMSFGALWMAMGTFSFLAKAAVMPGLTIFCIGAISIFGFEYISRRFKCFQDDNP